MAHAAAPHKACEHCAHRRDDGDVERELPPLAMREQPRAGVKRCETEGYNPTQNKLNFAGVDGHGEPAERQQIPKGRMDADAVFKPE